MKRWIFAFFLVVGSSALAGSLYTMLRTPVSSEQCTMEWLARELKLTDAQYSAIWALHEKRCPQISELAVACGPSSAQTATSACEQATGQLIAEVCAELTPAQRTRYLDLIADCREHVAPSS